MKRVLSVTIGLFVMACVTYQALAVDFNFYGNARVKTWWEFKDAADGATFEDGSDTARNLDMGLQGNSRVGARIRVNDELSGLFEVGVSESTVNTRHLIGHWDFGQGVLSIGQSQTPLSMPQSVSAYQDDRGMLAFGEPWTGRRPMLQLAMNGLKIALVKPHGATDIMESAGAEDDAIGSRVENVLPRFEVAYAHSLEMLSLDLFGGVHSYKIKTTGKDYTINSYMSGAGFMVKPGDFYVRGIGYLSRNPRQFGQAIPAAGAYGSAFFDGNDVVDSDVLAGTIYTGASLTDRVKMEVGYGYSQSKADKSGASTAKVQTFYAQANVSLTQGVFVTPEIGLIDNRDTGAKTTYVGAKWQANF